jgi:predicted negative regulator of RcsB-dependent stress response
MAQRHAGTRKSKQGEPDDVFVAKVLEVGKWAETHQQLLTVLGVVAAILVLGLVYYRSYRQSLNLQAATELEQVYQSVSIADLEGARGQLGTFLERFAGTAYEPEARLLLGELYLSDGSPEQAQVVLRPLGESPRGPIEFQAAALLAAALEENREWREAEEVYLRIADRSELDFQVRNALAAAARIRRDQGDAEGAIALYQRLIDHFEETDPRRGQFQMRIQEIESAQNA